MATDGSPDDVVSAISPQLGDQARAGRLHGAVLARDLGPDVRVTDAGDEPGHLLLAEALSARDPRPERVLAHEPAQAQLGLVLRFGEHPDERGESGHVRMSLV